MEDDVAVETRPVGDLPMQHRALAIRAETFDEAANTVEVTFTTGARGTRFMFSRWELVEEELSTDPTSVRLDRINAGGPVLNSHNSWELSDQIGAVVPGTARMENGVGVARLMFSRRDDVAPIVQDIRDGIIRNVSVGYVVHEYQVTEREGERPIYRGVDWEPYEISFVSMPFDAGAQVRGQQAGQGGFPCIIRRNQPAATENAMEDEQTPAVDDAPTNETRSTPVEPAPVAADNVASDYIRRSCAAAGLGDDVAFELIARRDSTGLNKDQMMAEIGRRFAERDAPVNTVSRVTVTRDSGDVARQALSDAMLLRMSPQISIEEYRPETRAMVLGGARSYDDMVERAQPFRHMGLLRMAEEYLSIRGVSVRGMSAHEVAERALHTSSDFANLTGNGLNRRLRMSYEENRPSYRMWARRAPNAPDFRAIDVIQMSAMPDLVKTNEAGEFKYGTASDDKVSYALVSYGRIISLSRQLIVNDDLRALDRSVTAFAGSAARTENRLVYQQLTSNPTMPDGVALFAAGHGNLAAAGAAISASTLSAGRAAMRLQKGLQSEELNLMPRYLIVPATQEQAAHQVTSNNVVPTKTTDVNEFREGGRTALMPIVEAVLDANSTTAWYLASGNDQCDTVEYCYLDGMEGPQISSRVGFNVDGVEIKAVLDFAAGVIDHRGLYRNPGA